MLLLSLPSILTPDLGLLFWMIVAFLLVFSLLAKYAFPIIIGMVENRKQYIDDSLTKAYEANERLASIQQESERLLNEARTQQAEILSQAKAMGDSIIHEARNKAKEESIRLIQDAKSQIAAEKENALHEIRQTVADMSVAIAEKVVRQKLSDDDEQQQLIERLLEETYKA